MICIAFGGVTWLFGLAGSAAGPEFMVEAERAAGGPCVAG